MSKTVPVGAEPGLFSVILSVAFGEPMTPLATQTAAITAITMAIMIDFFLFYFRMNDAFCYVNLIG